MDPDITLRKNGTKLTGESSFSVGDSLQITIVKNETWGSSKIEIRDPNGNLRFMSRQPGDHEFEVVFPLTRTFGDWKYTISIADHDGNLTTLAAAVVLSDGSEPDEPEPTPIVEEPQEDVSSVADEDAEEDHKEKEMREDTTSDSSISYTEINEDTMIAENEAEEEPEVIEEADTSDEDVDDDPETDAETESTKASEDETLEEEEVIDEEVPLDEEGEEDQDLDMNSLSESDQIAVIADIDTEEDLEGIIPIVLDQDDVNDLEIPIAELEEVSKESQQNLKESEILYISHLLETAPVELYTITGASVDEVKSWLDIGYRIYNNEKHGLRKEYRKIRAEYLEFQRQLDNMMESARAMDPLSVLVGVDEKSLERLSEEGIENVGQLLQIPLVDLINLEVDPDKPLLPKLWLANAKSHVGIK
ncbi:MAG: hypothetical protein ACXAE3_09480 [Candidatus Kariarchaeaceae archaeon]|jgi:hypothetical protein